MKKFIVLLLLLITTVIGTAQQLYFEAGKTISSFDYKNSQGQSLDNLQASNHSFMTLGYRNQLFVKKLNSSIGIAYAGYGAIGSDDTVGNFMEWDVNYLEFNLGLDYELFKIKEAAVYIKGTSSAAFLMQGTQTLNNKVINLKNVDDFNKTVFDFRIGLGFLQPISENLSFYAQYMYGKSLDMASGDAELKIASNQVGFGLLINISKKNRQQ
ncbi:MAG: outer membrane beta-barrel protein [Lutibacter sp.]|uniref:outer membrane beta-barrel protein n=1 Tax=Lutibacter sp. TaxID=1925666 RepID=UPI003858D26E